MESSQKDADEDEIKAEVEEKVVVEKETGGDDGDASAKGRGGNRKGTKTTGCRRKARGDEISLGNSLQVSDLLLPL